MPSSFRRSRRSTASRSCRSRSSAPSGSSSRSSRGSGASARASATRCASPPDSEATLRRSKPGRPTRSSSSATRPSISGLGPALPSRRPKPTLAADVAVGEQLVVLEHQPEAPRGAVGTPARSCAVPAAPGRRRARSRPAITRSSVLLPDAARPEQGHDLAGRRRRGRTPSSTGPLAEADHARPSTVEHQNVGSRVAPEAVDGEDHDRGQHHQDGGQRVGLAEVERAGPAEQAVDGDRHRRAADPGEERGGAELAERDGEGEPGAGHERRGAGSGRSISRHTRAGRGAEHGGRVPQARVDRRAATGSTARTTNGMATSAWAIGMRIHEPRRSSGRAVHGDEQAEADGDGRRAEREHQPGVEQAPPPAAAP